MLKAACARSADLFGAKFSGGRQLSAFYSLAYARLYPLISPPFTSMKQLLLILILTVFSGLAAQAQQTLPFTRQLQEQKAGQGTVVLIQDEEITRLVNNMPVETSVVETASKAKPERATKPKGSTAPAKPAVNNKPNNASTPVTPNVDTKVPERPSASTTYTGRRVRQKVQGYRIQVFSGSGNAQAKQTAKAMEAKIRSAFPELAVYCHFKSPRWICRAGDFATRAEAQRYLTKIRNLNITSEASIVSDQVFVVK